MQGVAGHRTGAIAGQIRNILLYTPIQDSTELLRNQALKTFDLLHCPRVNVLEGTSVVQ